MHLSLSLYNMHCMFVFMHVYIFKHIIFRLNTHTHIHTHHAYIRLPVCTKKEVSGAIALLPPNRN
jgi:hypothetical protein